MYEHKGAVKLILVHQITFKGLKFGLINTVSICSGCAMTMLL
ncbi:hypothetical protein RG47T_2133 [Mucilaginibacter polytrichastri]|uniref:Uncharacterized protein n=1 Tax=Mucilaginibacter polytrichastri TaxID=1302689 RepID=A0A1Q5ZY38_9SPHI|nr:hypothetical protein RG47T_2133 [Mucilaginibacter polytrichastri]